MNIKTVAWFGLLFWVATHSFTFAQEREESEKIVEEEAPPLLKPPIEENKAKESRKKRRDDYSANFETDLTLMAVYPWGAVLQLEETVDIAVLRFAHRLTHSNSLKFRGGIKMTPITLEADFKATLTPIAFLQLFVGSGVGSGWSFGKFHGFAKNVDRGDGISEKIPINMKEFFFNTRFGTTFQFDLGAVAEHKWAHLVFLTDQGFKYAGASNMTIWDSWVYAEDYGENRNSWIYFAKYVVGYLMPTPLSFVAMQIETERKLYTTPENKKDWADDLMSAYITPIFVFTATKFLNIVIAPQFFTRKNYIYDVDTFYEHNRVKANHPQYLEFYRIAISCMFTFKH